MQLSLVISHRSAWLLFAGLAALARDAASSAIPLPATVVTRRQVADTSYDFVIAGGGIAGLTVANRLTEDPAVNVLVIEAGPLDNRSDNVLVPGLTGGGQGGGYQWRTPSEPQPELGGRTFRDLAGRVVGGGSVVNAMIFLRGHAKDFASWTAFGNKGWTWDDVLPYYIKSETFHPPSPEVFSASGSAIRYDGSVHGLTGPVQVSIPSFQFEGSNIWYNACIEAGLTPPADPSNGESKGIFALPTSVDPVTGTRSYARSSQYDPVAARPNYHLLPDTTVDRVLFDGTKATGLSYLASDGSGGAATVSATKEVLVAAGAIHTPPILQRSGVGPAPLLNGLGINVVSSLPGVGQNLQVQGFLFLSYNFTNNVVPNQDVVLGDQSAQASALEQYKANKTGPLMVPRPLGTTFGLVPLQNLSSSYLDIIAQARATDPAAVLPAGTDPTVLEGYKAQREQLLLQFGEDVPVAGLHWNTGSIGVIYLKKPLSRGYVEITTADPAVEPRLDYRALADPADRAVGVEALRRFRDVFGRPSMRALGPVELPPLGPGAATDEQLAQVLARLFSPANGHASGTAAMLPRELGGVVDDQLRVYGTSGLRVVDISYEPLALAGVPQATVYMTGEKIADVIKGQYGLA